MKALIFLILTTVLSAQTADTICHNAKMVTVDTGFRIVSGLAVKGDRILAADDIAKLKALAGPHTKLVDLKGRTVISGLIDNHLHFLRDAMLWKQQALIAHTRSNAYLLFKEKDLGSLQAGKLADFLVHERDYLTVDAGGIKSIRPVMTIVGGKVAAGTP